MIAADNLTEMFMPNRMLSATGSGGNLSQSDLSIARTYVLIPGAWHGGWVFKTVAGRLRAMGHTVYAPSLTGLGDRRHLLRPDINLHTHAQDILNLVELEDLSQIVLVGWSYGGMVVGEILAKIPEKIASVVYLDAVVPERGRSLLSYSDATSSIDAAVQLVTQNSYFLPPPAQQFGITDPVIIDYVNKRMSPHPVLTYLQASNAPIKRPDVPHTFVLSAEYAKINATLVQFYKSFQADPLAQTHVLQTSHAMMLTDPRSTLEILAKVP